MMITKNYSFAGIDMQISMAEEIMYTKKLLNIIEILVNQTELNNMNINDLKAIKEEIGND